MKIEVPFSNEDKELVTRFETHLTEKGYAFKKKKNSDVNVYIVEVEDAQQAYWLGCNSLALLNRMFDGPMTRTL